MENRNFALTALSAALLSSYAQMATAADNELAQYISPNSSAVSVGVGSWSGQRMQQGKFDGMRDKGSYGSVDGSILKRDDETGTWTSLYIRNFGIDDNAEFGASYEKQGDWGVNLNFNQIKRDNPVTINTGLRGIGTTRQTVTVVAPGAGSDVLLDLRREGTTVSGFKRFSPELQFKVSFRNEEKEGSRQWGVRDYPTLGSTAGSYAAFVAEPINSTTRQLDALLDYKAKDLSIVAGYYGSWYNNKFNRLDVIGTALGVTEMSLPPDNQAHQLYVRTNYAFTPTTRGLFKLAYTHATQNDPFIATMNNNVAAWAPAATVGGSLDGVVNTTDMMASLSARPTSALLVRAEVSYFKRDDKTPVRVDQQGGMHNSPFKFANFKTKLDGDYRLTDIYAISAGLDTFNQKRGNTPGNELFVPYRSNLDETTYRVALRRAMSEELNGSISFLHSNRTGNNFGAVDTSVDSATITPFYLADRNRDKLKFSADWAANEAFGLQTTFAFTNDRYPTYGERKDGVRRGTGQIFSLDGNLTLSDNWKANAWYSLESTKIGLAGPVNGTTDWIEDTRDQSESFGLGIKGKATGALTLGAKLELTQTRGDFTQTPGSTSPLPSIVNKEFKLNLFADYAIQKNSSIRVDLISERYRTDDWQWKFANGTDFSYATEGTRVSANPNQSATFVGVRYSHKFQ